jgi:hypothetical protein
MPKEAREAKFIVVAKGSFSYSSLGEFLNTFYRTDGEEIHFLFGEVPREGFYVTHGIITRIKTLFPDFKERFEFFSQEGGGKIRKYAIPKRKKTAKEKMAAESLRKLIEKKKP